MKEIKPEDFPDAKCVGFFEDRWQPELTPKNLEFLMEKYNELVKYIQEKENEHK